MRVGAEGDFLPGDITGRDSGGAGGGTEDSGTGPGDDQAFSGEQGDGPGDGHRAGLEPLN